MDLIPTNKALDVVEPEDLADYLQLNGWKEAHNQRKEWRVFLGDADDAGEPFEMIVPRKRSVEGSRYLANSVNLLSQLTDEPPELVVQRIQNRNHDVLHIYDLQAEYVSAIALESAAKQTASMKQLVVFGALSEKKALPYYQRLDQVKSRSHILNRYQFGHTVNGGFGQSFGFTIIAPVGRPETYSQRRLFEGDESPEVVISPVERRVMERIVRGLQITVDATRNHAPETIAGQYPSGFNGNMCTSIIAMSNNKDIPLEYRILWSPRITPSQDVERTSVVQMRRLDYSSLETAANMLKKVEPQRETIRGRVTALSSSERPLSNDAQRGVIINWLDKDRPGPSKVLANIDLPEDYQHALRWHEEWDIIEVTGYLQRYGNYWRLRDATEFHVVSN